MAAKLASIMESHGIKSRCLVPPINASVFSIMNKLRQVDEMLDPTDIMIVSHALADRDSKFFLTTDSKLLGNYKIAELERGLHEDGERETKLKIQD